LVAVDGAIPIAVRQDTISPLSRTVKDTAYVLNAIAGRSERDLTTWDIPFSTIPDFSGFYNNTDLSGVSIGVVRNGIPGELGAPLIESFEAALKTLASAGANVVENTNFPAAEEFKEFTSSEFANIIRSSEFRKDIAAYLSTLETNPNDLHTLDDIIKFTETHPEEKFPEYNIDTLIDAKKTAWDTDSEQYHRLLKKEEYFGSEGGILGALEKHSIDVLAFPSPAGMASNLFSKVGYPALSVPLGFWPEETAVEKDTNVPGKYILQASGIP
jgi:amidase